MVIVSLICPKKLMTEQDDVGSWLNLKLIIIFFSGAFENLFDGRYSQCYYRIKVLAINKNAPFPYVFGILSDNTQAMFVQ